MNKTILLYNPIAGNGEYSKCVETLEAKYSNIIKYDVTKVEDYSLIFAELTPDDTVVLCGGDGTINRFVNDTCGIQRPSRLYYYAGGTGNDFLRDIDAEGEELIELSKYIASLPTVTVEGKDYYFINGVGYGIDGYCCEVGDKLKAAGKKVDYTAIAIKGLLFHYKPTSATVTVDGVKYEFKKVWIAPTMNGRFYGGGMMPTPSQDRLSEGKKLSIMIFHGSGKVKTLMIFPSLFKGEHIKHTKNITILEGHEISVSFDSPVALQIDGETHLSINGYEAHSAMRVPVGATM